MDQPRRHRVRLVQQRRDPPRPGLPPHLPGPGPVERRLGAQPARPAEAEGRRPAQEALLHLRQPAHALHPGLLRALDLRLRPALLRPDAGRHPGGAAPLAHHRPAHQDQLERQLGRQPGRRPFPRPRPAQALGPGEAGLRAGVHVLPAAHLRALPQPLLRGLLPVGRAVQALGGRHRAGGPGPLPGLADVRDRLPVQEGVLQPPHRQGREVHLLLPARRGRHPHRLLRDVRGTAALHRPHPVRRRPRHRGRLRS